MNQKNEKLVRKLDARKIQLIRLKENMEEMSKSSRSCQTDSSNQAIEGCKFSSSNHMKSLERLCVTESKRRKQLNPASYVNILVLFIIFRLQNEVKK
jgi:hypothetical protein